MDLGKMGEGYKEQQLPRRLFLPALHVQSETQASGPNLGSLQKSLIKQSSYSQ